MKAVLFPRVDTVMPRGYRNAKSRQLSVRAKRDERLVDLVAQIHASNYSVYGVRKMWHALFVGVQRYVTGKRLLVISAGGAGHAG